jgi:hypothetical protein
MTDPLVYLTNRDVTDKKEAIHTHHNDDIKIEVDSKSLVGRTDPERGAAQKIVVAAPLVLRDGQLFIDIALIGDFADDGAAAAGGVPIGGIYRGGSALKIRVA